MSAFYHKAGKFAFATTPEVWAGILVRQRGMTVEVAAAEVAAMISDGRLVARNDVY
jgi:hypothetical protein